MLSRSDRSAAGLSALLGVAGLAHLGVPGVYEGIVPRALPGSPLGWTVLSGVAELVCASLVARPGTRRLGATLSAALFVVIFPANVEMALQWRHRGPLAQMLAFGRLPLQAPLVWWALQLRQPPGRPAGPRVCCPRR